MPAWLKRHGVGLCPGRLRRHEIDEGAVTRPAHERRRDAPVLFSSGGATAADQRACAAVPRIDRDISERSRCRGTCTSRDVAGMKLGAGSVPDGNRPPVGRDCIQKHDGLRHDPPKTGAVLPYVMEVRRAAAAAYEVHSAGRVEQGANDRVKRD